MTVAGAGEPSGANIAHHRQRPPQEEPSTLAASTGGAGPALTLGIDYAVRAALDLACHYRQGRRKRRELAAATGIPPAYLSQPLALLVSRKLLIATAGRRGGYELARPPSAITLLAVVDATSSASSRSIRLRRAARGEGAVVRAAREAWAAAREAFRRELARTTLADLCGPSSVLATPPPPSERSDR